MIFGVGRYSAGLSTLLIAVSWFRCHSECQSVFCSLGFVGAVETLSEVIFVSEPPYVIMWVSPSCLSHARPLVALASLAMCPVKVSSCAVWPQLSESGLKSQFHYRLRGFARPFVISPGFRPVSPRPRRSKVMPAALACGANCCGSFCWLPALGSAAFEEVEPH